MNATYSAQIGRLVRATSSNSSSNSTTGRSPLFAAAVREQFSLDKNGINVDKKKGRSNVGTFNSTPLKHVSRSAAARLLTLYSLDYAELGLPLPAWLGCL